MRKIKNQIKLIVSLFVLIILFQSCIAYKSISVTLEQSVKENVKTKINTNYGKILSLNTLLLKMTFILA